jgi:hypothetical protein
MPTPQLLTHSRLQSFRTCPRKHFYEYELAMRPAGRAKTLRMGSAFHEALDQLAKGATADDVYAFVADVYRDTPDGVPEEDHAAEGAMVAALVIGYEWRWREQPLAIVASEDQFTFPIRNPETGKPTPLFEAGGKYDKIVRLDDGRLALMEHKTTSDSLEPNSDYWRRLRLDTQITGYMDGARANGYPVETVIYDVVRKPAYKPRRITKAEAAQIVTTGEWFGWRMPEGDNPIPERETPPMFMARVLAEITAAPERFFQRVEIPRNDADREEYRHELWQQQQAIRQAQLTGRWFRNTGACLKPYKCPYFSLCSDNYRHEPGASAPPGFEYLENPHAELTAQGATPA